MAEFLVELYFARADREAAERGAESASSAAQALADEGVPVRVVRSIYVPDDETCFLLFEAGSADGVRQAIERAGLPFERISEAIAR